MMQLFKVNINMETVVYADCEESALDYVDWNAVEIVSGEDISDVVSISGVIKSKYDLPDGWHGYCIPWGEGVKSTIKDILWEMELKKESEDVKNDVSVGTVYKIVPGETAPCDLYAVDPDGTERWIVSGTHTQCCRVLQEINNAKKI